MPTVPSLQPLAGIELVLAIQGLYPELSHVHGDFRVETDDSGIQRIAQWNNPHPIPTDKDLERGWFLWTKRAKRQEFVQKHREDFIALFPDVDPTSEEPAAQANHLMIVDILMASLDPSATPNKADIKALRDKLKRGRNRVEAVTPTGQNPDYIALATQVASMDWSAQ